MLQCGALFLNFLKRHTIDRDKPYVADAAPLPYHRALPYTLLFIFIGLIYTPIAPLLLPVLLVYFGLGYIVYRNQVRTLVIVKTVVSPTFVVSSVMPLSDPSTLMRHLQILNVYEPSYETGGQFWPFIHGQIIFGLFVMQITMLGLFGVKDLPKASSACIPLPIITLLFNEFCKERFLPVFERYSLQVPAKLSFIFLSTLDCRL